MNERNVEALIRVYREVMDELGLRGATAITVGDTAEALASRGVLGPASEVLTEVQQEVYDIFPEKIEALAKGEIE